MRTPRSMTRVPVSLILATLVGIGIYVGCTQDFDQFGPTGSSTEATTSSGSGIGGSVASSSGMSSSSGAGMGGASSASSSSAQSSTASSSSGCGMICSTCMNGCCNQDCQNAPCMFKCGSGCKCTFDCQDEPNCVVDCNGASPQDCTINNCPNGNQKDTCDAGVIACKNGCPP